MTLAKLVTEFTVLGHCGLCGNKGEIDTRGRAIKGNHKYVAFHLV